MGKLINLMTKDVVLEDPNGPITFLGTTRPALVRRTTVPSDMVLVRGVKVFITEESVAQISGVPPQEEGTLYIVPAVVAAAVYSEDPDRDDLVVPMGTVKLRMTHNDDKVHCSRLSKPL